ncbi:DegT/DnrJ/EryC1/StrS family aminotransferase [Candidatus Bathyarchaeota archaeon]|nr:DegT/DnrJ/EryC1/StrS family aminotransferase [Candidatus Bathyarchaeota archaeon]
METRNFFYPLHEMPPYHRYANPPYPVSLSISREGLSLPSSVKLTEEDVAYISSRIKEAIKSG